MASERSITFVFVVTLCFLFATAPFAATVTHTGPTKPMAGWIEYCEREPIECYIDMMEDPIINIKYDEWPLFIAKVTAVNFEANRDITAIEDIDLFGFKEYWYTPVPDHMAGDCEDIQLYKRQKLVALGYPKRAMRMAVVIDELGEGHAVLIIRTSYGDIVLDNKINDIVMVNEMVYSPVKMENENGEWVRFK